MNSNKSSDSLEGSVTQKTDLEDPQQKDSENSRRNNGGYSWWKWRRSTESADKKSPQKDGINDINDINEDKISRQSVERVDEMKEIMNDLSNLSIDETQSGTADEAIEPQTSSILNAENADVIGKNDDSISSELADVSKTGFCSEKYRKTLRLTSEQIVSDINGFIRLEQNGIDDNFD